MPKEARTLLVASRNGDVDTIRRLGEVDLDVNTVDERGSTAANIASRHGHVEAVRLLAELGADLNIPMHVGATPVYIASQEGHLGCK